MSHSPTVADVLDLEYPGEPSWSAEGEYIATAVTGDDGATLLVADPTTTESWRVRPDGEAVSAFEWSPTDARLVASTDDGRVVVVDPDERSVREIASTPGGDAELTWGPDGERVAFYRDGTPWIASVDDASATAFDVPERGPFLGGQSFAWTEEGDRLAYRFVERNAKQVGVVDIESGELTWRTRGPRSSSTPAWLADDRLLFVRAGEQGTVRQFVAVDTETGAEDVLYEDRDEERGTISRGAPNVSPDGERIATAVPTDGWEHIHVIDSESGKMRQLTDGAFEDKGVAGSQPQWLDDSTLVFASNRRDAGQRQLFAVDADSGAVRPIVESEGTNVHPAPSPDGERVVYVHASRALSSEVRVSPVDGDDEGESDPVRVTRSRVEEWDADPIEPERVSFEGPGGLEIEAYLLDPREHPDVDDDATELPGVVYVHGGPMRQMRDGWHPSRSYGLAYAVHQHLAAQGYAGIFVNYRGGIGYGTEFQQALAGTRGRDEITDMVRAGEVLGEQSYVDAERVGMWGLSYGGYAALQVLGTHPDAFSVAVNLAGVADTRNYREWATETKFPEETSSQPLRIGGQPETASDEWDAASPITHMEAYEAPLYSFHGTDDAYVNVEQLDLVVDRLLELDKEFEFEYYPGENHVFRKRSVWRRTIRKMTEAFDEHLR